MSGYGPFAKYYDVLTANIDYAARADFFDGVIKRIIGGGGLVLDLACGTGSLSVCLAKLGYEVIGADASAEMLSVAMQKSGGKILYLNQSMDKLDLYGTVRATICALDSVNHVESSEKLLAVFKRVSLFTEPGGLFIFDVNTGYKHREVLGDNAFIYELPEVYCCWRNAYHPKDGHVDIALDFFSQRADGLYTRETETFSEWIYSGEVLAGLLDAAGFRLLETLDENGGPPLETSQRLVYVAQKQA